MMSVRPWRNRRVFWHALVFWVWLASFVFGFAASDLFHAANCPDELVLRVGGRSASSASAPSSHSHALQIDASCPTCLLQLGALGILAATLILWAPLCVTLRRARSFAAFPVSRLRLSGARGPPLWFI